MSMIIKQSFCLIVTVVNRGFSDKIVKASRDSGAEGATILNARGTGLHETDTFLGVDIQPEKEVVLTIMKKQYRKKVMRAIVQCNKLNSEGMGICFSVPLDEVAGVYHLFQKFKNMEKLKKEQQEQKTECGVENKDVANTDRAKAKESGKVDKESAKNDVQTKQVDNLEKTSKELSKNNDVEELKKKIRKEN